MKKNKYILTSILLLGLTFAPIETALADNNLVQVDLKKGNGNAVDVTFFTSENYGGNVIVRKKSDNKYVILMPKVLTSGYRRADLGSVRDLVTNIDVKSVNDGAAGYTKITMITTKPLNITTHVSKAIPLTDGQQQYRTLIAEAYTVKNNVNKQPAKAAPQPTEVTVDKAPANVQPKTQQGGEQKQNNTLNQKQTAENTKTTAPVKLTPIDNQKLLSQKPQNKIIEKVEKSVQNVKNVNYETKLPEVPNAQPKVARSDNAKLDQSIQDIKEVKNSQKQNLSHLSPIQKVKNLTGKVKQKMSSGLFTLLIFVLMPLIACVAFIRFAKSSLKTSSALKKSFVERISGKPHQKDYEHIINNADLNWQEKYHLFLNQTGKDSMPRTNFVNENINENSTTNLEEQRKMLESLITPEKSEEIDNTPVSSEHVKVHKEEDSITENLKNVSKIKAFEPALTQAKRSVKKIKQKSRFTRFATREEHSPAVSQHLSPQTFDTPVIEKSLLSTNTRNLQNANLKIEDVKKDDYLMSSLDEFFSTPETPVAQTLAQIKPSMKMQKSPAVSMPEMPNPIVSQKSSDVVPQFSGLIVKNGYNINDDRGFYIVNLDGTSALIGRIKEEIFVLKKFNDTEDKHLQVRHDKDNIYMVRTEGFKSLVDIENMGILIEL